eukprot:200316-Pleurochrysis_carterae.AAC.1
MLYRTARRGLGAGAAHRTDDHLLSLCSTKSERPVLDEVDHALVLLAQPDGHLPRSRAGAKRETQNERTAREQ